MQTEVRPINAQQREALAAFLQACRKRLTPEQVGLPAGERRRVKGLRREEVAVLSGISVIWYTWLEQGRPIKVSEATLDALAQVLRLSEAERTYLFLLAAPDPALLPSPIKPVPSLASEEASLMPVLDALDPNPALLRDHHWDILAWNQAEAAMYPWQSLAPEERNLLLYLFTSPQARSSLPLWEEYARSVLRIFRLTMGQFPPDERFATLVRHLQERSSEFELWWEEHTVQQDPPTALAWCRHDGKRVDFSIVYMTFPLHPLLTMRVLFPHQ
jgi:transcriptional regulator with XRE-family HTH domain